MKVRFVLSVLSEKPILEILLDTDNKLLEKSLLKLKKSKKILITTIK